MRKIVSTDLILSILYSGRSLCIIYQGEAHLALNKILLGKVDQMGPTMYFKMYTSDLQYVQTKNLYRFGKDIIVSKQWTIFTYFNIRIFKRSQKSGFKKNWDAVYIQKAFLQDME